MLDDATVQLRGLGSYTIDQAVVNGGTFNLTANTVASLQNGTALDKTVGHSLTINNLAGAASFIINTDLANNQADQIAITSGTAQHTLQVAYDPLYDTGSSLNGVAASFAHVAAGTTFTAVSTEYGAYRYTPTLEADAQGTNWSITGLTQTGSSETAYTASGVAAGNLVLWRWENNSLNSRMGELRNKDVNPGDWFRIYKGEHEMAGLEDRRATQQYTGFQYGHDKVVQMSGRTWRAGYAVGFTDANSTFSRGEGDSSSLSVGAYATWLGDKGHYLDLVVKQGRLSTSYDSYLNNSAQTKVSGSYHNWGTSASAEYGYRKALTGGWYVEPQAEVMLGRVSSANYTASDGTSVNHNAMNSVIGRLGLAAGRSLGNSSLYAKASIFRELSAKSRVTMSTDNMGAVTLKQDLKENWLEFAVGLTRQLQDNTNSYLEISRTTGEKVKAPWRVNLGVRWGF
jgi:outer membrane autotransporter protein